MSTTYRRLGLYLICIAFAGWGCDSRSDYERLVERELASGTKHNALFLGYELGMSKDAFYERSWALNRQGLVMQGPRNQTVQYELEDELPHPAKLFFYPDFYEDKVFQMRVRFLYDGWAPWNRDLSADSLQTAVVDLFETWYGKGFVELEHDKNAFEGGVQLQYVKVDGNRRIVVGKYTDSEVLAVITDLVLEKQIEDENGGYADKR